MTKVCDFETCTRPAKTRGLCGAHAERARAGRPLDPPIRETRTLEELLGRAGDDECWLWQGSVDNTTGYGRLGPKGAHRASYEHFVGEIPAGLQIDHLCRNRRCVNPAHLEAVSQKENILRGASLGAQAVRTNRCCRDHEFTPENTYIYQGNRYCRACVRLRRRLRGAA